MCATSWVSIAFHVNTGICRSKNFRDTAAWAGKLDVAMSIPEVWLANKGLAVGPIARVGASPHFFLSALHLTYFCFCFYYFVSSLLCRRATPHGTQYMQSEMEERRSDYNSLLSQHQPGGTTRAVQSHPPPLTRQRSTEWAGVSATVLGHAPLIHPEKGKQI